MYLVHYAVPSLKKTKTISRLCLKLKAHGFKIRKCKTKPERQKISQKVTRNWNQRSRSGQKRNRQKQKVWGSTQRPMRLKRDPRSAERSVRDVGCRGVPLAFLREGQRFICRHAPRPAQMRRTRSGVYGDEIILLPLPPRHRHSFLKTTSHPSFTVPCPALGPRSCLTAPTTPWKQFWSEVKGHTNTLARASAPALPM